MQKDIFDSFHSVVERWVMSGKHTITLTQLRQELPGVSTEAMKEMMRQAHRDGIVRAGLTVNGIPMLTIKRD
jgi:hypothetical protein